MAERPINRDKFTHLAGMPAASSNDDGPESVRTRSGQIRDVTQKALNNHEVQIEIARSIVEDFTLHGMLPATPVWTQSVDDGWLSERGAYEPVLFLTTALSGGLYVASPAHLGQFGIEMHLHCLRMASHAMNLARQGAARIRARYDS